MTLLSLIYIQLVVFLWIILIAVSASSNSIGGNAEENNRFTRNGKIDLKYRWKNFFMFLDPEYNDDERKVIEMASNDLQKVLPCVKFWIWPKGQSPAGYKERYIHIKKVPSGCSSDVGKTKTEGAQTLSLAQRCVTLGTVIHEMIHALGFHHEHSQPDRDKYVTVNLQNVQDNRYNAFRKYTDKEVSTFGVPYNTKSLMHYSSKDFSKDGKPTIVTKDGKLIEKNTVLQQSDVLKLKGMYKC